MSTRQLQGVVMGFVLVVAPVLLLPYVEVSGVNRGQLNFYSPADERRLGAGEARRIETRTRIVAIPACAVSPDASSFTRSRCARPMADRRLAP